MEINNVREACVIAFLGVNYLDRYSEKTGFITAYCGICREWNLMDNMQQKCRIGFSGMCRNRTDFCGNKYYYRGSCRMGDGWLIMALGTVMSAEEFL